jgi:O-methyltransferase
MDIRELATVLGCPGLRRMVQRGHAVGLETLLDYQRLAILAAAVRTCLRLPGDMIELGSYRGGSAAVIGQVLEGTDKTLHILDTFEGLPAPSVHDNYHLQGDFADTCAEDVRRGVRLLSIPVEVHVGLFDETLPLLSNRLFSFAHIDVDLYDSIKQCLEFCYPRMLHRGIIIIDDYGAPTCLGAKKAVDEFFLDRLEKPVLTSKPACAVCMGSKGTGLADLLRRRAGWISAFPFIGPALYRN